MEVLTKLLGVFLFNFTAGGARLAPDALWLLGTFFSIEIGIAAIWFMMRRELDIPLLVQHTIKAAVLMWLITNWPGLTKTLIKSFIGAGLKAGGDVISETDFTDPDNIALYGLSVTAVIFQHLRTYAGLDALKNIVEILGSGVTAWLVVILYFCMAIWIFITLLEFYLTTSISVILLPWAMFSRFSWITEKAIAHLFASGVRLLILSFILGSALPVMFQTTQSASTGFDAVLRMFLSALALLLLCWRANSLAQGLLHGAPSLVLYDASKALQNVVTHLTQLGAVMQGLQDTLARSDPSHSSRQSPPTPSPSRRPV